MCWKLSNVYHIRLSNISSTFNFINKFSSSIVTYRFPIDLHRFSIKNCDISQWKLCCYSGIQVSVFLDSMQNTWQTLKSFFLLKSLLELPELFWNFRSKFSQMDAIIVLYTSKYFFGSTGEREKSKINWIMLSFISICHLKILTSKRCHMQV